MRNVLDLLDGDVARVYTDLGNAGIIRYCADEPRGGPQPGRPGRSR
jgi:hypothetical protein